LTAPRKLDEHTVVSAPSGFLIHARLIPQEFAADRLKLPA
jgi:hypothetical protein